MEQTTINLHRLVDVDYNDAGIPNSARAIRPQVFHDGDKYCGLFGKDPKTGVFGCGTTVMEALQDWDQQLQKFLNKGRGNKDLIESIIISYMAYNYELSPPKTDNIIRVVGLDLKEVEKYHREKRHKALIDRIYEILQRLGAEEEYLKTVEAMDEVTARFLENSKTKIALLGGRAGELDSIDRIATGEATFENVIQQLDEWLMKWDKTTAEEFDKKEKSD